MNPTAALAAVALMAGITYLIRALPIALVQKPIRNKFVQSFLYYVPYAVLAAMVLPDIFTSTNGAVSAAVGFAAALVLAWFGSPLLVVALSASAAVFLTELVMKLLGA